MQAAAMPSRSSRSGATITWWAPVTYSNSTWQAGHGHGSVRIAYQSPSPASTPSNSSISSSSQTTGDSGRVTRPGCSTARSLLPLLVLERLEHLHPRGPARGEDRRDDAHDRRDHEED